MKVKVLFLASNPVGTEHLKLDEEVRAITEKIRASEYRDLLEFVSVWAVRPDDLLQALNEHKPHIVHFSGHGSSAGEIILLDSSSKPKPVSTRAIKALFTAMKDNICVVLLNACYSKQQAEAITEVIDCAIGMNSAIGDQAAIVFAASFYRAIGFGRSVQEAFEQANVALMLEDISEENTPELLVRAGVDSCKVFPILTTESVTSEIPQRLKELIDSGSELINVPLSEDLKIAMGETSLDYPYYELKMRQSDAVFVFRVPKLMEVGDTAEYLASKIFPKLRFEDYEWSIVHDGETIPSEYTFLSAGIPSGATVYLIGNHRRPEWAPQLPLTGLR